MEVFETPLPGIGVRYEFETSKGERIGVVVLRDGRRDLLLYDEDDPDSCKSVVELEPTESATMVELLGGSKVTERLADLRYEVEGLAIEWVTMGSGNSLTGRTIGDSMIRTRTGASVVAVIRGETSIPGPSPDFRLEPGDVVLLMGAAEGVQAAATLLAS